eukprot:IDg6663t1
MAKQNAIQLQDSICFRHLGNSHIQYVPRDDASVQYVSLWKRSETAPRRLRFTGKVLSRGSVTRTRQMAPDYVPVGAQQTYVTQSTASACGNNYMVGRGASFSPDEDTALARCWVGAFTVHDEQNASDFWERVAAAFCEQSEATETLRTACRLQSRCSTLQKLVQNYLAVERLGATRTASRDGPTFRSLNAVSILRWCPKFGGTAAVSHLHNEAPSDSDNAIGSFSGASTAMPQASVLDNDDEVDMNCIRGAAALSSSNSGSRRPLGIKKAKRLDKVARAAPGVAFAAIAAAMDGKTALRRHELRFKCINALPDGPDKTKMLFNFLDSDVFRAIPTNDEGEKTRRRGIVLS